jgi:hypothetical protein
VKHKIWLLALVGAVLWCQAAGAQSDFYVIAGSSGVGQKINSVPYIISAPGFYYLGGNLSYSGIKNAIVVAVDDVTIDLMGFSLTNAVGVFNGSVGIAMNGRTNVEVRNGTVRGFDIGIFETATGNKHRVINVRATNNVTGIAIGGNNHLINNCNASNNTSLGLQLGSGMITNCVASNNPNGITITGPGSIIGNMAINNTVTNFRIGNATLTSIMVDRNSAFGLPINYSIVPVTTGVIMGTNSGLP